MQVLKGKIDKAHSQILKMIEASQGVADKDSLGMFYLVEDVLKRMKLQIEESGNVDKSLYEEFNKVKRISVRAFEGTDLDDLIWDINSLLKV
jgi:hypothetical protein